jgi:hypothetical protein
MAALAEQGTEVGGGNKSIVAVSMDGFQLLV